MSDLRTPYTNQMRSKYQRLVSMETEVSQEESGHKKKRSQHWTPTFYFLMASLSALIAKLVRNPADLKVPEQHIF